MFFFFGPLRIFGVYVWLKMARAIIMFFWIWKYISTNPTWWGYPCLQSKAAASKVLTIWLAERAVEWGGRPDATEANRVVASCMHSYAQMLRGMSESNHIMTQDEATRFFNSAMTHLRCYVWLHDFGRSAGLHVAGRHSWLLLPKLHFLWHLAHDTKVSQLNPRMVTLLSAESFIGKMGRIARATHRSTVSARTLERYQVMISFSLQKLRRELSKG